VLRYVALIGVGVALFLAAPLASADAPERGDRTYYVVAAGKKDPRFSFSFEDGDLRLAWSSIEMRCRTTDGVETDEFVSGFGPARVVGGKFIDRHRSRFFYSLMAGRLSDDVVSGRARVQIKHRHFPGHPELSIPACNSGQLRFEADKVGYRDWRIYNAKFGVNPGDPHTLG
jgi:hypothetical protein